MTLDQALRKSAQALQEAKLALADWQAATRLQDARANILRHDYDRAVSRHLKARQAVRKAALAHVPKVAEVYAAAKQDPPLRKRSLRAIRRRLAHALAHGGHGHPAAQLEPVLAFWEAQVLGAVVRPPGESF